MLRVTKVKVLPGDRNQKLLLNYEDFQNSDWIDEYQLKSTDEPLDSFHDAIAKLIPWVLFACDAQDCWDEETIKVTGVSFSFDDDDPDALGAVVSAQKKIELLKSPLVINTPHYLFTYDDPEMDRAFFEAVLNVQTEALAFIRGDRKTKQQELF